MYEPFVDGKDHGFDEMKSNTQKMEPKVNHTRIANLALDELAKKVIEFKSYLSHNNVIEFAATLVDGSNSDQRKFLDTHFKSEKSITYLYERFFPETARFLGNQWSQDLLTFGKVTVGIGNLQVLLKQYDHLYSKNTVTFGSAPNILLLTPPNESHTFGSLIAHRMFKNLGCNSFLMVKPRANEIQTVLEVNTFSLIGISLTDFTLLDEVKKLVALIRTSAPANCPIILGGEIENWTDSSLNIPGLDAISSKPADILEMCDLKQKKNVLTANQSFVEYFK